MSTTIPPVPHRAPMLDGGGHITQVWSAWFRQVLSFAEITLTGLVSDVNVAAAAAIDATKIANGSVTNTEFQYIGTLSSNAQTQLTSNATSVSDHLGDTTDAHAASAITNTPAGNLAATTVQGALNELQSDVDARATLTPAQYGVLVSGAGSALGVITPDASTTKVLTSGGASANPTWQAPAGAPDSSYELSNLAIAASVAGSALTIALKQASGSDPSAGAAAVKIGLRNSTAATGTYAQRTVTAALSVVVSSGSTLGSTSGNINWVYVYAIDNAGTVELAVSAQRLADEGSLVTTTAEGGAGAADSGVILYSTTARTNVACRLIGRVKSTQATAGTWATAPSEISLAPFGTQAPRSEVHLDTYAGFGSGSTKIPYYTNSSTTGTALTVTANTSTLGAVVTVNEDGLYAMGVEHQSAASGASNVGVTKNSASLTTNITSITSNTERVCFGSVTSPTGEANVASGTRTMYLPAGTVLRPHTNGQIPANTDRNRFWVTTVSG